ncbi:hypothetical protein CC79DRAFT_1377005 [Sarocladium strictum]
MFGHSLLGNYTRSDDFSPTFAANLQVMKIKHDSESTAVAIEGSSKYEPLLPPPLRRKNRAIQGQPGVSSKARRISISQAARKHLHTCLDSHKTCENFSQTGTLPLRLIEYHLSYATYLWIDAVCLVQDDIDEWRREAPRMADTYSNAMLCISADSAASSESDLITPLSAYPLELDRQDDSNNQIFLFPVKSDPSESFQTTIRAATITSRAWTMQERFLSPRILHIGRLESFLECWQGVASEDKQKDPVYSHSETQTAQALDAWYSLAMEYSARRQTNFKDRLFAFHALTQRFEQRFEASNLYGLWTNDPYNSLLWFNGGNFDLTTMECCTFSARAFQTSRIATGLYRNVSINATVMTNPSSATILQNLMIGSCGRQPCGMTKKLGFNAETANYSLVINDALPSWSWLNSASPVNFIFADTSVAASEIQRDGHAAMRFVLGDLTHLNHSIDPVLVPCLFLSGTVWSVIIKAGGAGLDVFLGGLPFSGRTEHFYSVKDYKVFADSGRELSGQLYALILHEQVVETYTEQDGDDTKYKRVLGTLTLLLELAGSADDKTFWPCQSSSDGQSFHAGTCTTYFVFRRVGLMRHSVKLTDTTYDVYESHLRGQCIGLV